MALIFRSMVSDGSQPRVCQSRDCLGVRVPGDIQPDAAGLVRPGGRGLSVASDWRVLPYFLIPRRLRHLVAQARGNNRLTCWRMGDGPLPAGSVADGLQLFIDTVQHGLIEPSREMLVTEFQTALAATQGLWRTIDEDRP
jgi:hypothetical protein